MEVPPHPQRIKSWIFLFMYDIVTRIILAINLKLFFVLGSNQHLFKGEQTLLACYVSKDIYIEAFWLLNITSTQKIL
jgi:hypothetical protein